MTEQAGPGDTGPRKPGVGGPRKRRSRLRGCAFRLIALVLIPLLFFGLLEGGLRLFGYGYSTDFFEKIEGQPFYRANPRFSRRFFPRALVREPVPLQVHMPAEKGEDTYRVFVLGGSAALGVPDASFALGRGLQVMLQDTYPGTRFEVMNVALTAINSHVVLPIAQACARHEPDLFVVFMGTNEVTGPFGAGTIFQAHSPSLMLIRSSIRLKSTRIGQMIENLVARARPASARGEWRGLEMFMEHHLRSDDPRLSVVYSHYRRNLLDICDVAERSGAKVALCTMAVNLKDCAPFASEHRPDLAQAEQARWEERFRAGIDHEEAGDHAAAIEQYLSAAAMDDTYAELQFRLGRCYVAVGRFDAAREAFIRARDEDALHFRADSRTNQVIHAVATERAGRGVFLVDAEAALADAADAVPGLPGVELFFDHVHLRSEGHYQVARAVFEELARELPETIRSRRWGASKPPSVEHCAERLALTTWHRLRMLGQIVQMLNELPFIEQLDHQERQEQNRREMAALRARMSLAAKARAVQLCEKALERAPGDLMLRANLAALLMSQREFDRAVEHSRFLLERRPGEPGLHYDLARALFGRGRPDGARKHMDLSVELASDKASAHWAAARFYVERNRLAWAEQHCRQALELQPNQPSVLEIMGVIHMKRREWASAADLLSRAADLAPDRAGVQFNLAVALARTGEDERSLEHLAKAVELAPEQVVARRHYAEALRARGRLAEAAEQYARAVAMAPEDLGLRGEHAALLRKLGRDAEAVAQYESIVASRPGALPATSRLAQILATSENMDVRDVPRAVRLAQQGVGLARERDSALELEALEALATVYVADGRKGWAVDVLRRAFRVATWAGEWNRAAEVRKQIKRLEIPPGGDEDTPPGDATPEAP